jgi:CheY-like chemotaxis protein/anti-sigma regulatory factor (Ser/Thr protein kinase)
MDIREEAFDLGGVMQSIEDIFTQVARGNGNALRIRKAGRIPEKLYGDSTRLTQVLFNLVGNACKYTQQGSVDVAAAPLPSSEEGSCRILFTVSDTGPGIADEKLEKVFEQFTQARDEGSCYSREFEGAGLGLPLARRLVDLMGGTMSIDAGVGEGTVFYVSLPFRIQEGAGLGTGSRQGGQESSQGRMLKVLLADDDPATQLQVQRLLEKQGMTVRVAPDGEQVLADLAVDGFDCILMDVQMPVLDGLEATRRIRSSRGSFRDIPIIALTAFAMSGDRERFLAAGMDDVIAKPVDLAELLEVVHRHTGDRTPL